VHVINVLLLSIVFGVWRGTGGCSDGCREEGLGSGGAHREQDGGGPSLGVTGSSIDQQCRTDFCATKYARDSFNLTTSVES